MGRFSVYGRKLIIITKECEKDIGDRSSSSLKTLKTLREKGQRWTSENNIFFVSLKILNYNFAMNNTWERATVTDTTWSVSSVTVWAVVSVTAVSSCSIVRYSPVSISQRPLLLRTLHRSIPTYNPTSAKSRPPHSQWIPISKRIFHLACQWTARTTRVGTLRPGSLDCRETIRDE